MNTKKRLKVALLWLPSVAISFFYIPNAFNKLFNPSQTGKVVESSTIMIISGIFLLIAAALYLYKNTILIGTCMLSLYMTFIMLIHIYKGKPYEVAMLIVMCTVFASYIRKPKLFYLESCE